MNQKLGLDNSLTRHVDRGTRDEPQYPLTEAEKERLKVNCWKSCFGAYFKRVKESGLLGTDTYEDLPSEAQIFVDNILEKFDKKPYLGKIVEEGKGDVAGTNKPKTLEFYFEVYFSGVRVQLMAAEVRSEKKKKGHGPRAMDFDVTYDEYEEASLSSEDYQSLSTGKIKEALKEKSFDFQRYFIEKFFLEIPDKEMREDWGVKYNGLSNQLEEFFQICRNTIKHDKV